MRPPAGRWSAKHRRPIAGLEPAALGRVFDRGIVGRHRFIHAAVQGERGDRHRALALADVGRASLHRRLQLHRPHGRGRRAPVCAASIWPHGDVARACIRPARPLHSPACSTRKLSTVTRPARGLCAGCAARQAGRRRVQCTICSVGSFYRSRLVDVPRALRRVRAATRVVAVWRQARATRTRGRGSSMRSSVSDGWRAIVNVCSPERRGRCRAGLVDRSLELPCATVLSGCRDVVERWRRALRNLPQAGTPPPAPGCAAPLGNFSQRRWVGEPPSKSGR